MAAHHAMSGRFSLRVGLVVVMWALLVIYVVGLLRHGEGFDPLVDGWLGIGTQVLPAAVCWSAVSRAGVRRREIISLAVGVSSFALGTTVFVLAANEDATLPFPSVGDLGYLCFYPAALIAIAIAVRREHRAVRGAVWLDSLLGGLGGATVLAVVVSGALADAAGSPLEVTVSLAYPIFDAGC